MDRTPIIDIEQKIEDGNTSEAIENLQQLLASNNENQDNIYYLLGNAYRKMGNWQMALNNYQYAIDINPISPAKQARAMVIDILNFYNKDMFNH
ncbi:Tetratricopeptide TPR_1 repeat-containing protein [Bacteroides coprosuis DSM 18011]|uniref:Tetratricopeptide TPR_1 repeat-containing protein n=1 Tax=Bacteroides coprosuis DSM 18011 TaxID=679937 RepID=F3ZTW2_9BACE|nr:MULTISPECIES: tetratricopeptide repeat protein [Bacteroides]EGJ72346.1 Tetratricopeptide TPR_1 repeat-containing protein [Bacteroides coprosuis DSM 18011]HJD91841.1 tetratricopeptide repeat protein [Bacteroides coprosuis]